MSGGTVVVGAALKTSGSNFATGAAYVFVRSGTTWTQQQKLTASNGAAYDTFGSSVAVSGNTAVIGAYGKMVGSNQYQGAAYVYVRNGVVWSQQQELTAARQWRMSARTRFTRPVVSLKAIGMP